MVLVQDWLRVGGTERQGLFLAEYLQRQGDAVTLVVFRPGGRLMAQAERAGIDVRVLQAFDSGLPLWAPGLRRVLRGLEPEVVVCLGRSANCYAEPMRAAVPGAVVVSTVRTGKRLFPLHRRALMGAAGILVNSQWWADELRRWGLAPERVGLVRNALLTPALAAQEAREARRKWRGKLGTGEGTPVLVSVQGFRPGKRQGELVRVLAGVPGAELWLAGEGSERRRCERLARALGVGGRVRFLGHVGRPQELYAAAEVAVSASVEDAVPNFLVEAQASGLPVVAVRCRGVEEAFEPGASGLLVEAGAELVGAVGRLLGEVGLRQTMGWRAVEVSRERFEAEGRGAETRGWLERWREKSLRGGATGRER